MFVCTKCGWLSPKAKKIIDTEWGLINTCGVCGADMIHAVKCYCGGWISPENNLCEVCLDTIDAKLDQLVVALKEDRDIPRRISRKVIRETI